MISEETALEIRVREHGHVEIATITRVLRDGVRIGESSHNRAYSPGEDISGAPGRAQVVAAAVWTPDVLAAYAALVAATTLARPADAPEDAP